MSWDGDLVNEEVDQKPRDFVVAGWWWIGHFSTPTSALLSVGRELLVTVNVYFLCMFVQRLVLWTLSAQVWWAMQNSPYVCGLSRCSPGAGPACRRDIQQARMRILEHLRVSGLMPSASSREQKNNICNTARERITSNSEAFVSTFQKEKKSTDYCFHMFSAFFIGYVSCTHTPSFSLSWITCFVPLFWDSDIPHFLACLFERLWRCENSNTISRTGFCSQRCCGDPCRTWWVLLHYSFCNGEPTEIGKTWLVRSIPLWSIPLLRRWVPEGLQRGQVDCGPQGTCACPQGWMEITCVWKCCWRGCKKKKSGFCLPIVKPFTKGLAWLACFSCWLLVLFVLFLCGLYVCFISNSESKSHSLPGYSLSKSVSFNLCVPGGLGWVATVCTEAQLWCMHFAWHKWLQVSYLLISARLGTCVSVWKIRVYFFLWVFKPCGRKKRAG